HHFWLGPRLANRPLCMGEWQGGFSLTHPSGGLPLSRFAHVRSFFYLRQKFARLIHALFRFSDISSNRPSNREVEHVPAYSHSNRWVGVGGACSNKWIGIGEIRGSQGNRNYRRGPVRLAQRSRNESVAAAP